MCTGDEKREKGRRRGRTGKEKMEEIMNESKFTKLCKSELTKYINGRLDKTDRVSISEGDIFIVWMCKTLQNNKALLSTTLSDGMYYECTYNGDRAELYIDAYKKWENICTNVQK